MGQFAPCAEEIRHRLTDGIAPSRHAGAKRALVAANVRVIRLLCFFLGRSLLLRCVTAAHRTSCSANSRSNGRSLSCIAADGTPDCADCGASCRALHGAALRRRSSGLLHRLVRTESGLLFGPFIATELVLFLLLLRLALTGIHEHLCSCKGFTRDEQQSHHDDNYS